MNFKIILLIVCCSVQWSWAQKDTPFKTTKLKLNWDEPAIIEPASTSPGIEYKSILEKDDSYLKRYSVLKKDNQKTSVLEIKSDFKNPGDEIKDKLNNKSSVTVDLCENCTFLGSYKVSSRFVKIFCWDYQGFDEDLISILHNREEKAKNFMITEGGREIILDLINGENIIDFKALNEGLQSPNTAAFIIYDDVGNIVAKSQWLLLTGETARIAVINQKSNQ